MVPFTCTVPPFRRTDTSNVTDCVTPRMVKSPVALTVPVSPSVTPPSTVIGSVSVKVAVGYVVLIAVLIVRPQGIFGRARAV